MRTAKSIKLHLAGGGKKDEEPTQMKNNLPKHIRLRSALLINLRPSSGIKVNNYLLSFLLSNLRSMLRYSCFLVMIGVC